MNEADAKLDRQRLSEFFLSRGLSVPTASEKHFRVAFDDFVLRWEQHSEFTTYTWEIPHDTTGAPFHTRASFPSSVRRLPSAGELLVAIDLEVVNSADGSPWERLFDRSSLAGAAAEDGTAIYATDFRVTSEGFVRVLVLNQSLDGDSAGALTDMLRRNQDLESKEIEAFDEQVANWVPRVVYAVVAGWLITNIL